MKKLYKRDAYYLDEGILLHGHKDKYGFHPEHNIQCGFSRQLLNKKDVGRVLFYSLADAISKLGEIELAGGTFILGIDDGSAITKIVYSLGDLQGFYMTETLVGDNNVEIVIQECLYASNIKALHSGKIKYILSSELPRGVTLSHVQLQKFKHEIVL